MPKFNAIKNNFLKGEYSPKARGRTDIEEYFQGADELTNVFGHASGGVVKRRGSIYLTDQEIDSTGGTANSEKDIDEIYRIFPFKTSDGTQQLVCLGVGDNAGGWDNIFIYQVAAGGASDNLLAPTGTSTDDFHQIFQTVVSEPSSNLIHQPWSYIASVSALNRVKSKQIGDIIFFAEQNMPMFWIKKNINSKFSVGTYLADIPGFTSDIWQKVPYKDANPDSTVTMAVSNAGGGGTGPWSAGTQVDITVVNPTSSTVQNFESNALKNRIVKVGGGAAVITAYNSGTGVITARVLSTITGASATASWEISAWGGLGYSLNDYPSTLEFHEQRLYAGGSFNEPSKIYASQSGDISEFSIAIGGVLGADDAFGFALSSTEKETIRWMSSGQSLFVGTDRAEYRLYGPDPQESVSATNKSAIKETQTGSSELSTSIKIDNSIYFTDASGIKVREYIFNESENAYRASNPMRFSDHMTRKSFDARSGSAADALFNQPAKIFETYYSYSEDLLFLTDIYQGLTCVSIDRESGLFCPTQIKLGGSLDDNDFVKIHSACVMPGAGTTFGDNLFGDELFLFVERTVNSAQKFTIEKIILREFDQETLAPGYTTNNSIWDGHLPIYLDGAVTRNASGTTTTLSGLGHLEGEDVDILADGKYVGQKTVSSGSITLDTAAQVIVAGLSYEARIKTLRIDQGSALQSSQRALKRIDELLLRFYNTVHCKVGASDSEIYEIEFRDINADPGDPIALYTGDKVLKPKIGWDRDQQILVTSDKPYPMFLCALVMRGITND